MTTTDLTPILQRLDTIAAQVAYVAERQRKQEELFEEMMPIAREAMAAAIARLDQLDKDGTLAFAGELVDGTGPLPAGESVLVKLMKPFEAMLNEVNSVP